MQKTNIIRDYLEDINEIPKPRMFWPRDIWGKYASKLEVNSIATTGFFIMKLDSLNGLSGLHIRFFSLTAIKFWLLQDFKEEENSMAAVECLNELITNALSHALDCLTYMAALKDPAVFRFCAIPQVGAA